MADSFLNSGTTYGMLNSALLNLGFHETADQTQRRYEKQDAGAVILLPRNISMEEPARAVHLLTARHTVVGFGIADETRFEEMLKPSRKETGGSISRLPRAAVPVEVS